MNMNEKLFLNEIREELKANIDKKYKESSYRFFKEKISLYGVKTPKVRQIARKYFNEIKSLNKKQIFDICYELFKNQYNEEATIAIQFIAKINDRLEKKDFKQLDKLYNYVNNWGKCDDFCLNVISHFIVKFPQFKKNVKLWTKSNNMWRRRASAVAFIRGGSWRIYENYLEDIFEVAIELLYDKEDLVQKGYGWMLKITSEIYQKQVFEFVMKYKSTMPRTALRYAIEKMPPNLKKQAMK